ncbi:MAG: ABC transporter ATP-binding protein, partial [Desulfobacterales bacterium]|nr:ABC transporter ATP-binding protein [Desulfobacterales bacterium]
STLMNILGCLDRPTDGDYILDGTNVSKMKEKQLAFVRRNKIGFIFQTYNLLPRYTALKNVELPLIYKGVRKSRRKKIAEEALAAVGLKDRIHHKPSELSGGQRQRVAIARALVNEPRIILADEPTGNLDSKSEEEILNIMHNLHERGITIVMVTHDLTVAQHAERIVSFRDGEIIKDEIVQRTGSLPTSGGEVGEIV